MSNQATNIHLEPEELADYFAGILPEDWENRIEIHFAWCAECTSQARRFQTFTQMWNRWTAPAHGEAYWGMALTKALQATAQTHPHWRERLQRWRTHWAGKAEAAVRVVMAEPGMVSHLVTEGLEVVVRAGGRWRFAPDPGVVPIRGTAVPGRGDLTPLIALAPGKPRARVAVSGDAEVSIRVDEWPPGPLPPLVLWLPTSGKGQPQVKALERPRGVPYLSARFADIDPGEYLVAFEPLEAGEGAKP